MDITWDVAAAIVLGAIVGYLSIMFIARAIETDATAENLIKFLGIMIGGTAIQVVTSFAGADNLNIAQYIVGLGAGIAINFVIRVLQGTPIPTRN